MSLRDVYRWLTATHLVSDRRSLGSDHKKLSEKEREMEEKKLSVPGALVGALVGLGVEIAIRELTGFDVVNGILEIIGAGFGLIRIDRRIYESTVRLLNGMDVEPDDDYQRILRRIDDLTVDLPELRQSFLKLMEAGLRAKTA